VTRKYVRRKKPRNAVPFIRDRKTAKSNDEIKEYLDYGLEYLDRVVEISKNLGIAQPQAAPKDDLDDFLDEEMTDGVKPSNRSQMSVRDAMLVLGITGNTLSKKNVKAQFRKFASKFHPDAQSTDEEKEFAEKQMLLINTANDTLEKFITEREKHSSKKQ